MANDQRDPETGEYEVTPAEFAFVRDLRMSLTVNIGSTTLTLREVLELAPDSIIQLPRSTGEGVDVNVNGVPLARGEMISIEDRAVIRIKEILHQPQG